MENMNLNYLAILTAVVINIVIGNIWYGPLFGKAWAAAVGIDMSKKPPTMEMVKSMGLMVIGSFLMAWVFAHNAFVWNFLYDKTMLQVHGPAIPWLMGFYGGFYTWLGFIVPLTLNSVAFEGKPWKLFGINAGYYFISLQVIGMVLAYWK
ncbi:hypothetical protein CH373_06350 [Leptospira perolatii]|uniref:DUF1761 domain-containing protein n=1 Tax=Leptospira perolatii TaxID=2023191 RepID=A0A2M9ZNY2_9LEPT|nr:DUF1761 domain-containing protein [Leptospira perolatii]PJZ70881.1 hypothetical protein CH360_05080 [Leptospira perolatii]PJZ73777.1 hypothetical protein CH373_06350 [Leptospira perolatii]